MTALRPLLVQRGPIVVALVALVIHARYFNLVCDDAFLALRQAQNLALHGSPVYNLGERVEVATSPLWMLLLALELLVRVPPVAALQGLGLFSGMLLMLSTWALTQRFFPERWEATTFALVAVALTAPIAAWSIAGLEAPLFTAGVTLSFVRIDVLDEERSKSAATQLGIVLALTCLVRLEALPLVFFALLALRKLERKLLARVLAIVVAPLAALTLFRLAYYGLPLPHTFFAKTSGIDRARVELGLSYVKFFAKDYGIVNTIALVIGPIAFRSKDKGALLFALRFFAPLHVAYVILVGGDFLDLYRFFIPLIPILIVLVAAILLKLASRYEWSQTMCAFFALMILIAYGARQLALTRRSLLVADAGRAAIGIEPLGWTKSAAREWGKQGQWLAGIRQPTDTLGTSAAGAIPFFSGMPNFDLLGLGSPDVAREGEFHWNRPGHTRVATIAQIQKHAPTFLMVSDDGEGWDQRGYVRFRVHTNTVTFFVMVRQDRVETFAKHPGTAATPR